MKGLFNISNKPYLHFYNRISLLCNEPDVFSQGGGIGSPLAVVQLASDHLPLVRDRLLKPWPYIQVSLKIEALVVDK